MVASVILKPLPQSPDLKVAPVSRWTPHRQPQLPTRRSLAPKSNSKLEKFRPQPLTLEQLKKSQPSVNSDRLSHRLYIDGVALPAQRVGSLTVVWREECEGFQLYSWELRSPLSSLVFETREYCCEAAVELGKRFDVDGLLMEQSFGAMEGVEAIAQSHLVREQIMLKQV